MIRLMIGFLACVACVGCESDIGYAMMSDDDLAKKDTWTLVHAYSSVVSVNQTPRIERILRDRGQFTEDEWTRIKARKIRIGDSKALVLASWGAPDDETEYTSASGSDTVWRWGEYRGDASVWFASGRVSLIRN